MAHSIKLLWILGDTFGIFAGVMTILSNPGTIKMWLGIIYLSTYGVMRLIKMYWEIRDKAVDVNKREFDLMLEKQEHEVAIGKIHKAK